MQRARGAVESALPDNQRAVLIRATKMNVAPQGLFVDSLFIDICGQIDSMGVRARAAIALVPANGTQIWIPASAGMSGVQQG